MAGVGTHEKSSSSSSSSSSCRSSWHVFLSFRGDTRKKFTDHLYTALENTGFRTFRDDDAIPRGESLKPELEKAIKLSRVSIIVFSKDYASSSWCLDELVVILEWRRTSPHVVLPVFYDVEPSDLRKQKRGIAKSFARYEEQLYQETDLERKSHFSKKIREWRAALREVADLTGFPLKNQADGYEAKFIQKIVNWVRDKLSRTVLNISRYFGITAQAERINLWLREESTNVSVIAICGMGGIGKTTLAEVVYNDNFERFDGSSFLSNIRESSKPTNGLVDIQKRFLSDAFNLEKEKIERVDDGINKIQDVICDKKVLLVLDDVDHIDQLKAIVGSPERVCPGIKIIVTTTHEELLKPPWAFKVHMVDMLDANDSIKLFNFHAFGEGYSPEIFTKLTAKVVQHCSGLPLAIKVLGSNLNGKSEDVWVSALQKLKVIPDAQIFEKLKISYDSLLDDYDKKIFLHIACFFVGKDKDFTIKILDACGLFTVVGIENLIARCLLKVDCNKLMMHQSIQDMGREIVRLESPDLPGKRSSLCRYKDSFDVLKGKEGTDTIGGLFFDMEMFIKEELDTKNVRTNDIEKCDFEIKTFAGMHKLKLLQINYVRLTGCYKEFPKELVWLCWHGFPLQAIPSDLSLDSLVFLDMQYSSLKQVWKGTKSFPSLKILDLSHSHRLARTPNFEGVQNIERLILKGCVNLVEFCESIGFLKELVFLDLEDCKNLRILPRNIQLLTSLKTLIISGCSNLGQFPKEMRSKESLEVIDDGGIIINAQQIANGQVSWWHTIFTLWIPTPRDAWERVLQVLGQQKHANNPDENTGSHEIKTFTPDEDEALCFAWLAVTEDAVKDINQSRTGRWEQIVDEFNERMCRVTGKTAVSLNTRWHNIQKAVIKFHTLHQKLDKTHWSREDAKDVLSHVKSYYHEVQKQAFKFETCYSILKDHPKWKADLLTRLDNSKKPQSNLELESTETKSLVISLKDPLAQTSPRVNWPTKRKEKKNQTKVDELSSPIPSYLTELEGILQKLEQKQNQDSDISIREVKLQMEELLQYKRREDEEKTLEKDLSKLPPEQAAYWKRKQEIIYKKWTKELQEEEKNLPKLV